MEQGRLFLWLGNLERALDHGRQLEAPPALLEERLRRRMAGGADDSDADLAVLHHQLVQPDPVNVLHDQIMNAVGGCRRIDRDNDIRMFKGTDRFNLLIETPHHVLMAGVDKMLFDDLDRPLAAELRADEPLQRLLYHAPPGDNKDLTRYPPDLVAAEQAKKTDG